MREWRSRWRLDGKAAQFREILRQSAAFEASGNVAAEPIVRALLGADSVAQDVADLGVEAVTASASLQAHLHVLFEIANHKLRHIASPTVNITISKMPVIARAASAVTTIASHKALRMTGVRN